MGICPCTKGGSHTSTEASQYSETPAFSMAAARSTLQLSQKVCASGLFSLHEQLLQSSLAALSICQQTLKIMHCCCCCCVQDKLQAESFMFTVHIPNI